MIRYWHYTVRKSMTATRRKCAEHTNVILSILCHHFSQTPKRSATSILRKKDPQTIVRPRTQALLGRELIKSREHCTWERVDAAYRVRNRELNKLRIALTSPPILAIKSEAWRPDGPYYWAGTVSKFNIVADACRARIIWRLECMADGSWCPGVFRVSFINTFLRFNSVISSLSPGVKLWILFSRLIGTAGGRPLFFLTRSS